jgi:hypothetical protein
VVAVCQRFQTATYYNLTHDYEPDHPCRQEGKAKDDLQFFLQFSFFFTVPFACLTISTKMEVSLPSVSKGFHQFGNVGDMQFSLCAPQGLQHPVDKECMAEPWAQL